MDAETDARLSELEDALTGFALRYSALEWVVEQHFAHYLARMPLAEAEAYLDHVTHSDAPAWTLTEEGEQAPNPGAAALLADAVDHIAGKIRARVRRRAGRTG